MIKNFTKWTLLIGALAVLSACNNQPQPHSGRVAIIDMSMVSKETGYTVQVADQLKNMQAEIQVDLNQLQSSLQEKVTNLQKDFGLTPTDNQKREVGQMMGQAQQEYKQAQEKAALTMQQEKLRMVAEFRKATQPVAMRIATSRGLGVVLQANETYILVTEISIDITKEVIEELKKNPLVIIKKPEPEVETEMQPTENTSETMPASEEMATEVINTTEETEAEQPEKSDQAE